MVQSTARQLIDYDENFLLDAFEDVQDMKSRGADYTVVAVVGAQNSGKSTVVNEIYGTNFEVGRGSRGRQTTRGLWLSPNQARDTLIIDVEGTDSNERGSDGSTFENRAATLCLVSADVVLVNVDVKEIGRRTGSCYKLLEKVLRAYLKITWTAGNGRPPRKTGLMFVVRNLVAEDDDMNEVEEEIRLNLFKAWCEVVKEGPEANEELSNFFELGFHGLPRHKDETFKSEARELWTKIVELVGRCKTSQYSKTVPVSGLPDYMGTIWGKIIRDCPVLDIPSEQILIANLRCKEFHKAACEEAQKSADNKLRDAEDGRLTFDDLVKWRGQTIDCALLKYDTAGQGYHPKTREEHREKLLHDLKSVVQEVADAFSRKVTADLIQDHYPGFVEVLQSKDWSDFNQAAEGWQAVVLNEFDSKHTVQGASAESDPNEKLIRTDGARAALQQQLDRFVKSRNVEFALRMRQFTSPELTPEGEKMEEELCVAQCTRIGGSILKEKNKKLIAGQDDCMDAAIFNQWAQAVFDGAAEGFGKHAGNHPAAAFRVRQQSSKSLIDYVRKVGDAVLRSIREVPVVVAKVVVAKVVAAFRVWQQSSKSLIAFVRKAGDEVLRSICKVPVVVFEEVVAEVAGGITGAQFAS